MRWKTKARIQRMVAVLPGELREQVYYRIQRWAGAYRSIEPWEHLSAAREIAEAAERHGTSIHGADVLEVGTGHRILVPIALSLLGAKRVTTTDVHRYLKSELVFDDLAQDGFRLRTSGCDSRGGTPRACFNSRTTYPTMEQLLESLGIDYRAPSDTGALNAPEGTFDLHVSRSVLEHVPPEQLTRMFTESRRVVRRTGLHVHLVDFSDHFSHIDASISSVNFLRYSDREWDRLAGNQFAYHNRLRSDDFERLFRECGLDIVESRLITDPNALRQLESNFEVDARFRGRDIHRLAHREGLFVLR